MNLKKHYRYKVNIFSTRFAVCCNSGNAAIITSKKFMSIKVK